MLVQLITERVGGGKEGRRMIFRLLLSYARMNAVDGEMAIKEGRRLWRGSEAEGTAVCSDSLALCAVDQARTLRLEY